ncbi:MAG: SRPBCC family protein [Alphaproteobacteria bacterium]|nr:MAG: SRPBCC family protein [Alphaproteobacteria bacterium]
MAIDRLIIRIAIGAVVLLFALAFALRADTVESTGSIEISAPPDVVWATLVDPGQRHFWMESVTAAVPTVGAYGSAASSMMLSVSQEGVMRHIYEDVDTSAPPLLLQTSIDDPQGVLQLSTTYELRPVGAGGVRTRLKISVTRGLDGFLAPYFAFVVKNRGDENVTYNLNAMKRLVESNL